jgi:hypothetical protein
MNTDGHGYQVCMEQRIHTAGEPGLEAEIRTTMVKVRVFPARIWSAVTCHRFAGFGGWSPKPGRVQRPVVEMRRAFSIDGDKSPA